MAEIRVSMRQVGPSTSEAEIRGHRLLVDRPLEKGGADQGPMGGELLLAALGSCFLRNLFELIRSRNAPIHEVRLEVVGTLEGTPPRYTAIELVVAARTDDPDLLAKFVAMAERACIVANTLKGGLRLSARVLGASTKA